MKKQFRSTLLVLALVGALAVGASAAGYYQIAAELRPDIALVIDGKKQTLEGADGGQVAPVTYNGTTYLPVRALTTALGYDVVWNSATQTITLTSRGSEQYPAVTTLEKAETYMNQLEQDLTALKPGATYTERVKQYNAWVGKLDAFYWDVQAIAQAINEDFRQGVTDYRTYNALSQRIGLVDTRLKDARALLEQKTIAREDSQTQQPSTSAYDQYVRQIDELETRVDSGCKDVRTNATRSNWRQMEAKLEQLDGEIEALDDAIERDYENGKLSASQYRALEKRLDALDDAVDKVDDWLDHKYDDD